MRMKSGRISASRDVKFQAFLDGRTVTIKGFVGKHTASDSYTFPVADYPSHPFDRKQFMDRLYRTFDQHPDDVGHASRCTDAMIRATNELVEAA